MNTNMNTNCHLRAYMPTTINNKKIPNIGSDSDSTSIRLLETNRQARNKDPRLAQVPMLLLEIDCPTLMSRICKARTTWTLIHPPLLYTTGSSIPGIPIVRQKIYSKSILQFPAHCDTILLQSSRPSCPPMHFDTPRIS